MPRYEERLDAFFAWCAANAKLFLVTCGLGLFVYAYALVDFSLSVDSENALNHGVAYAYITQGRWGISLLKTLFGTDYILPFFSRAMAIVLLSCSALALKDIFKLEAFPAYVFCIAFLIFPQFAYVLQFSFLGASVAAGILLSVLACKLLISSDYAKKPAIALAFALLVFSLGIYQSLALIPPTLFLFYYLFQSLREDVHFSQVLKAGLKFSAVMLCALLGYFACTRLILLIFGGVSNEYIDNFSNWGVLGVKECISNILSQYWALYSGNSYYGSKIFLTIWPALALLIGFRKKLRLSGRLLALLLLGCFTLPYLMTVATGRVLPARVALPEPLAFAGIWALAAALTPASLRRFIPIAGIFAIIFSASHITQLFFADTRAAELDKMLAVSLVQQIYEVKPDFVSDVDAIHISGRFTRPFPKPKRSQTFGNSFFSSNENWWRAAAYLQATGLLKAKMEWTLTEEQQNALRTMPPWPHPGAVQEAGGLVLIKFSE